MKPTGIEPRRLGMPPVSPPRTSFELLRARTGRHVTVDRGRFKAEEAPADVTWALRDLLAR